MLLIHFSTQFKNLKRSRNPRKNTHYFLTAVLSSDFDPDINIEVKVTRGQRPTESCTQALCFANLHGGVAQYFLYHFRFALPGAETVCGYTEQRV